MVKVSFIVEGETEKVLVDSPGFREWCGRIGIEVCEPVIDAAGSGNLLPSRIENYLAQIRKSKPDKIVVLTDLEEENSIDAVKMRIKSNELDIIFVAVKAVESWFLADSAALSRWLRVKNIQEEFPEDTPAMPWERLKEVAKECQARGPGSSKPVFARRYISQFGFSIERASTHPHCPSAKYFHDTLAYFGKMM